MQQHLTWWSRGSGRSQLLWKGTDSSADRWNECLIVIKHNSHQAWSQNFKKEVIVIGRRQEEGRLMITQKGRKIWPNGEDLVWKQKPKQQETAKTVKRILRETGSRSEQETLNLTGFLPRFVHKQWVALVHSYHLHHLFSHLRWSATALRRHHRAAVLFLLWFLKLFSSLSKHHKATWQDLRSTVVIDFRVKMTEKFYVAKWMMLNFDLIPDKVHDDGRFWGKLAYFR